MTGIDSCFLIDLYWKDSPRHAGALALYESLASGDEQILIYHNVFNEFIHVITDPRRFNSPLTMREALDITDSWSHLERVTVVYADDMSFGRETLWLSQYGLGRNRLNDTAMAACYIQNGASRIITANGSDFAQFNALVVVAY